MRKLNQLQWPDRFVTLAGGRRVRHCFDVSTLEQIAEKARALPDELQREALHYVDFLLVRQAQAAEARDWSRFASEQLAAQYSDADAIYDQS